MKYFSTNRTGRIFILSLDQGEYFLEAINDLIQKENIVTGVVVSGIGTLDKCTLHMVTTTGYPPVEYFDKRDDVPLELVSIQGVIADRTPHLHCTVSDSEKAYAGHLEKGCRVLYLCEVVIQELLDLNIRRAPNDKNIRVL